MGVQGALPPEAISFSSNHWLKPCYFGTILQNQCQILGGGETIFPPPLSKYWVGGAPLAPGSYAPDYDTIIHVSFRDQPRFKQGPPQQRFWLPSY